MRDKFNEDSRVKIPAILHLTRIGYKFLSKSEMTNIDLNTNIFKKQFKEGISKINEKDYSDSEIEAFVKEIDVILEDNDLGKLFYKSLLGKFNCKLI
ncbi:MAG TPA: hypothetical protein HA362_04140, partial [Nanoarchaeota archaeon]|nr:hypothetical protein [Nanoarchaeota archaeon]